MKNLVYLSLVALVAGLSACANDYDGRNYRYAEDESCSDALIKPAPAPAPVPCTKCQAEVCEGGNCYGSTVVTQPVAAQPVYAAQPAPAAAQPTVLY